MSDNDLSAADPFGPIADEFIELKSREWTAYHRQVTQWEIDQYLTFF